MFGIYSSLRKQLSWEHLDLVSLLNYYRCLSLLITSFFYLVGFPGAPYHLKVGIVLFLILEAFVFIRAYRVNGSRWNKKFLIFIETVGLVFIVTIAGGLDSPFLWYAINPILLAATLLPAYFCWVMMVAFISCAALVHKYSLYTAEDMLPLWPDRSLFFMIFILSTFAAQIFTYIIRRLSRQTEIMEKQLQHIKSLYEAIEVFSHHSDPQEVANLFASYSRTLTGAKKVIVWLETQFGVKGFLKKSFYVVRGPRDVLSEENWYSYIKGIFDNRQEGPEIDAHNLPAGTDQPTGVLLTVKVKSGSNVFGVLSAYYLNDRESMEEAKKVLTFLADLCAGAFEKRILESLAEEFLLNEEKDRIAGEIHDSVTQNIFGLIYGLDMLIKKEPLSEPVSRQLRLMQKTAQRSLKDLRASIYCMSSLNSQEEPFVDEVDKYLNDLGQLNNVAVNFTYTGNFGHLNSQIRKSLYRIVREATGNAIRHGGCSSIRVSLISDGEKIRLLAADNGVGFELNAVDGGAKYGLGLVNMKELARNMDGELKIESRPGEGTVVSCEIPLLNDREATAGKEKLII